MQATRNKPKCKENCNEHIFQLKNNNGNTKLDTRIQFCPKFKRDPHPPQKTIPQYNLDNKYFTHAFVLGTEKKTMANNSHHELVHFQTMIKDACQKNNQVFFPRPKQNNSFCSVCKQHFKNYYEHIRTETHRIKIDAAVYNTQIKKLCDFYKSKWIGAHEKADQLLYQIVKNSQIYQKSMKQSNQDERKDQKNQEDDQNDGQQMDEQEAQQQQEQEQQDSQQPNAQNIKKLSQKQSKQKNLNKMQQQQQQKYQNNSKGQMQNQQNKVQIFKHDKQKKTSIQQNKGKNANHGFDSDFFKPDNQLVIFLKKGKNGRFQLIKDMNKYVKRPQQKGDRSKSHKNTISQSKPQERYNLRAERERHNYKQQKYDKFTYRQQRQRRKNKERQPHRGRQKQFRQIFKIKNTQKQLSSQGRDNSSSYKFNQNQGLCQVLKNKIIRDRVKTRKQRREEDKANGPHYSKDNKDKQISRQKDKQKQKQKQKQRQKQKSVEKQKQKSKQTQDKKIQKQSLSKEKIVKSPSDAFTQQSSYATRNRNSIDSKSNPNNTVGKNPNNLNNSSPNPMGYPIFAPSQGFMGMDKNSQISNNRQMPPYPIYMPHGQLPSQVPPPSKPTAVGNRQGYLTHPPMMMNPPPYFTPGMMGYGTQTASQNNEQKPKQGQTRPHYPLYYPPPWSSYMMAPPMMRPPQQINSQQIPNANRQQMMGGQNPYRLMQTPSGNSKTTGGNIPNMNSAMPQGVTMPMYMQYPIDPRYPPYMGYPYMGKKSEDAPPKDPR